MITGPSETGLLLAIVVVGRGTGNSKILKGAMNRRKRIEATIETHEIWVIRRRQRTMPAVCSVCADWRGMLTPEAAAALAGVSLRTIYRRVEAGGVHFMEAADGGLLICLASLLLTPEPST